MKQKEIGDVLDHSESWVSHQFRGPSNWTLRTIGELVEALDGELEIYAFPKEKSARGGDNYDAYSGYGNPPEPEPLSESIGGKKLTPDQLFEIARRNRKAGASDTSSATLEIREDA